MTASSPPIVVCDGVTRRFSLGNSGRFRRGDPAPTVTAVDGVDLSIAPGEIVGLSGPSGSGKSTLLHLIAGLDTPTSGTVRFDGTDLNSLSARARTRHRLDNVGIVFQRFHLLESLSARANVALPLVERGVRKRDRRTRASELLDAVGLGDRATHKPGQLSGGEQQRVAIARAFVTDPALVIADEPTGELDTETGRRVLDLFETVAEDVAVVIASHDEPTLGIADRIVHLRDGRVVAPDDRSAPESTPPADDHVRTPRSTPDTAAGTDR